MKVRDLRDVHAMNNVLKQEAVATTLEAVITLKEIEEDQMIRSMVVTAFILEEDHNL